MTESPFSLIASKRAAGGLALLTMGLAAAATAGESSAVATANGRSASVLLLEPPVDAARDVAYRIFDYQGRMVAEGSVARDEDGRVPVPVASSAGYHEVQIADQTEEQGAGLWNPPENMPSPGGFLSLDTAMSWLIKPEDRSELIAGLRRVMGDHGLARERFSWAAINPASESWDWETPRCYDAMRRLYADAGIKVLEVFQNTPDWMGKAQGGRFPDDLVAAALEWPAIARRWSDIWGGLEVWNEPDLGYGGNQPADQYAPIVKTIRWAMADTGARTPLGAGVVAAFTPPYLDSIARNGLLDECDFFSFHYYGDPLGIERLVGQYRAWMAAAGHEAKPLWLTEAGRPRAGRSGVRPDTATQAKTALFYGMQAVEAKACGVARLFPFVYTEWASHRDTLHFGMLDHRNTPLRMLAAWAQAGRELSGLDYIGDVPMARAPGAARVRVFAPPGGDDVVVVVYTAKVDAEAMIDLPFAADGVRGADGRTLTTQNGGRRVPVPDGLAYAYAPRAALDGWIDTQTEAMRLWKLGQSVPPELPVAAGIVLQPQIDREKMQAVSARGYFLKPDANEVELRVGVNNLSGETRTVTVRAGGADACTVTVAARSREFAVLEVPLAGLPVGLGGDNRRIDITATADDGSRVAPAALVVVPDSGGSGVAEHLAESAYHFALEVSEDYRWEKSSGGRLTFHHDPSSAWGYTVTFPEGADRWAYPRFSLPQEVDMSRATGVLVRARCLRPASVRLMSWDTDGTRSLTKSSVIPADGNWHVAYVPFAAYRQALANDAITKISVGFNSQEDVNTLEISDLYVVGKRGGGE